MAGAFNDHLHALRAGFLREFAERPEFGDLRLVTRVVDGARAETVSKASFCIYLTHLFFLDFLAGRGLSAGTLPPVWGVPVLAAAAFGGGFLVWLVLRRVPVVKTYLI